MGEQIHIQYLTTPDKKVQYIPSTDGTLAIL